MRIDFGNNREPTELLVCFDKIINDRGSRYAASVGRVHNRDDIKAFLQQLKRRKKFAQATHNSWAARISHEGTIYETKSDDGETGAGLTILRELQRGDAINCVVCVTRWFGGIKLQGDRFRHLQNATRYALDNVQYTNCQR